VQNFLESVLHQGFAIVPEVLEPREMEYLEAELETPVVCRSRAGIRHAMSVPAVAAVARDPRLQQVAQAVLGPLAIPYRATLFDKSADSNWLVVWHQDTALPLQRREDRPGWGPWSIKEGILYAHAPEQALSQVVALRLHLDDSTEENGPLRVLPATHKQGVLTDDAIHELAEKTRPIECTVQRAGLLIMRPLLVHASSKSQAQQPRRVLHIEYAAGPSLAGFELAVA
jgi:ectoine hydroxylase-related dioxygenase (phytanoyl-CoA dioxygenase family)